MLRLGCRRAAVASCATTSLLPATCIRHHISSASGHQEHASTFRKISTRCPHNSRRADLSHSCSDRRRQSSWAAAIDQAKVLLYDAVGPSTTSAKTNSADQASHNSSSPSTSVTPPAPPPPPSSSSFLGTLFDPPVSSRSAPQARKLIRDPLELVGSELSSLRSNVSTLLGSGHPALDTIAKYYFQAEGKHLRPLIVLLMARATNGAGPAWQSQLEGARGRNKAMDDEGAAQIEREMGIDEPLSPREVLNDFNPHMEGLEDVSLGDALRGVVRRGPKEAAETASKSERSEVGSAPILPTQRRLAEITEMIHVASLLHDDVIDASELRRSAPSAPAAFGNKLSILGGDFLLGRASVALARLRDNEVVELLATVIANLVEGEVMQLRAQNERAQPVGRQSAFSSFWKGEEQPVISSTGIAEGAPTPAHFEHYLQKTYLKTAALMAKSARAAVILGGCGTEAAARLGKEAQLQAKELRDAAYQYGRNLGIAFQLVDDLLDFNATSASFGKPSGGADLRLGLATAPVLYAWAEQPSGPLGPLVARKFAEPGDVETALRIVAESQGLEKTKRLAAHHADLAAKALEVLPFSDARDALEGLTRQVVTRMK